MIVSSGYRKNGFDAHGGKLLQKKDMDFWMNLPERTDPSGVCFELGEEVEEVEQGFFELVPTICELWILNPECRLYLSEAEKELFQKNNVLVRGGFDTSAEAFARENHLCFLHIDTVIARDGDYFERGIDILTLCFFLDGSAYINQDEKCQGISAGNTGGGEVDISLPKDFYQTMSAKDVAGLCWGNCYDTILKKGVLDSLMKKAAQKNGFLQDYSKKR